MNKKSVPLKEKLIKCVIRIINDFPENSNLIEIAINLLNETILSNYKKGKVYFIGNLFVNFGNSNKPFNCDYLNFIIREKIRLRRRCIIAPLTEDIKECLNLISQQMLSNNKKNSKKSAEFLNKLHQLLLNYSKEKNQYQFPSLSPS